MRTIREAGNMIEARSWRRALAAHVISRFNAKHPDTVCRSAWPGDQKALAITKGAVSPTSRADFPGHDIVGSFRSLAPSSAALKLFEAALQLDMAGLNQISIPAVEGLPVSAVFVPEGGPAPATQWSFSSVVVGPMRKIVLISAVSGELESASPQAASDVIGRILAASASRGIDAAAFSSFAGDTVTPPGLLAGATSLIPAASGFDSMASDLAALTGAIGDANIDPSGAIFVCSPREKTLIDVKVGSEIFSNRVLTTLGLPPKTICCFAPAAIASGWGAPPTIETAKESVIHFSTSPADIVAAGTPSSPSISQFQNDLIAIRVRAYAAWCCVSGGAQIISNINW